MLTKRMEKGLDGNFTRMLRAVLNKSWKQHPTKQQLYGHLPLITKTIQVRRTRHAGHRWRSKDELIRIYLQKFCVDTGCSVKDLLGVMDGRDERGSGRTLLAASNDDDDECKPLYYLKCIDYYKKLFRAILTLTRSVCAFLLMYLSKQPK